MMNKLFLFAVLVPLLFAVPLAFAAASDDSAAGASAAASSGESPASSSGGAAPPSGAASSESKGGEVSPSSAPAPASGAKGAETVSSPPEAKGGAVSSTGAATVSSETKGGAISASGAASSGRATPSEAAPKQPGTAAVKADAAKLQPAPENTDANYSVIVLPPSANLTVGQSQQFIAMLVVDGAVPSDVAFIWSETGGVGAVTQDGLFTAAAQGSGAVAATYIFPNFSVSGSAHVLVSNSTSPANNSTQYSLFIAPPNATLDINGTQQFTVFMSLPNGSVVQVQNSDLAWSASGGIGAVSPTGLFTATAAGFGTVSATYIGPMPISVTQSTVAAFVTVNSGPPPPPVNQSHFIMISPSSATLMAGAAQQFVAQLYDSNGTYLLDLPNADLYWHSSNTAAGTIDALGLFSAIAPGFAYVKADYTGTAYANATLHNAANVTVIPSAPANVSHISVTPNPASLFIGQGQQFIATAYNSSGGAIGVLPNADLAWSVTPGIGPIGADGIFNATAAGSGMVSALYTALPGSNISGTASVSVSQFTPPPNGGGSGSGGSNSGGGSFKTSTTVSFSCAGEPGSVKITVFDSGLKNATVDIFHIGETRTKVFTQEIRGTTTLSFTPQDAGDYVLHVSVGADQTSASFFVPYCSEQTGNVTTNITVRLEPVRELIFSKLVHYPGGFSKLFSVYKITGGQNEEFETDIVLYLNYTGNSTKYDFDILDGVPASVVSRSSQVSFANRPSVLASEPRFEWHVGSIAKGGRLSYAYSFSRPVTEQMIALFGAPSIRSAADAPAQAAPSDGGLLAASIGPIFGINLPVAGVLIGFFALLALLYFFLFGRKKEEE